MQRQYFTLAPDNWYTNQVAIFATFRDKRGDSATRGQFGVVTTHLKAKSGYEQLRHSQGKYILTYLEEHARQLPVVVCGDLNASPDEAVNQEFRQSTLDLASAYTQVLSENREPNFTTWKIRSGPGPDKPFLEVCKTIDYIYVSKERVNVHGVLDMPSETEIGPDRLPSHKYPSDHLSLAVDITFT